jgi:hypothetical protein
LRAAEELIGRRKMHCLQAAFRPGSDRIILSRAHTKKSGKKK